MHITLVSSLLRVVWCLLSGGMLVLWVSTANAEPDPLAKPTSAVARAHLERGNKLYAIRSFEQAIAEYKAGALIEDTPVFQYNLAQAYRITGRYQEALWHYERFVMRTEPSGALREAIERFTTQMRAEIERAAMKEAPTGVAPVLKGEQEAGMTYRPPSGAQEEPAPWYGDYSGWALTASGLAISATSIYFLLDAQDSEERALTEVREVERRDLRNSARDTRRLGYALAAIGIGAASVGVIKLAVHGGPSPSASVAFAGSF